MFNKKENWKPLKKIEKNSQIKKNLRAKFDFSTIKMDPRIADQMWDSKYMYTPIRSEEEDRAEYLRSVFRTAFDP